ncbi:unnamed protein product [Linum tenue]|uniref:Uncharacterized protein n=1 Tax=Linum tenue TaxID=586396 RepID=A0AAV0Q055_9ROSI|nr:unnamed protein product [Linum tenue]
MISWFNDFPVLQVDRRSLSMPCPVSLISCSRILCRGGGSHLSWYLPSFICNTTLTRYLIGGGSLNMISVLTAVFLS